MDWMQMFGMLAAGGLSVEVVRQLVSGVRDARKAKGSSQRMGDALRSSRLWWMEKTHESRRVVIDLGGSLEPLREEEDPYLKWQVRDVDKE